MKYILIIVLFSCAMCNNKQKPGEEFEGRFKGTTDGISASANLELRDGRLEGILTMNGQSADLEGKIDDKGAWGTLYDKTTTKKYKYEAEVLDDELIFSITFPELNDRVIKLNMRRENVSQTKKRDRGKTGDLDPALFGTWKHTEILGGNGGESMTNESLMEFRDDGSCLSWPGRSSGPGYYRDEDRSNASSGKWYTEGGQLFFVDPETGQDASTNYSVNENGLLMSNGGSGKKVWERIQ